MSDASEVKRWLTTNAATNDVVLVVYAFDHDRIVAELKAEVARQAKQLELAKILYHAAIKMVDRYSKEKSPFNQTVTVEDVMHRYDKELEAIEQEEGT